MSVLLKKPLFDDVTQKELAEQLEAKKKCKDKLPIWFATPQIYYPNKIHIEQTSSEQTAAYKASLVSGKSLVDVTGGFGVDSYFFAKKFEEVIHCEMNENLSEITAYNFEILAVKNIAFKVVDGLSFLGKSHLDFDWVFVDPSRRNQVKGKVFLLKDCLPDIPKALDTIFQKTKNILVKTSPLLDISQGVSELKFVKEIHVVAVKNEVKELLWVLEKGYQGAIKIKTVNILKSTMQHFDFTLASEKGMSSVFALPSTYLYEPNAAILKSGGFKSIGNVFGLKKLHEHSHLYTSDELLDFPGRRFRIETVLPYNKKELRKLNLVKTNITTRNFRESVANLRKKLKLKDGGANYLFFTTDVNDQRIVIQCQKL